MEDLVEKCQSGDPRAFEELYRAHAVAIHRYMRVLLHDYDVEDAVQQVFTTAFRTIERFEGRSKFSTWLRGIAYRVALTTIRSRKRRADAMARFATHPSTPARQADAIVSNLQSTAKVQELLGKLRPNRRLALALYYLEERDIHEVAACMNVSVDNAWARIKRGRADLLKLIRSEQARAERQTRHAASRRAKEPRE